MDLFKELYFHLFNRITDALEQIQAQNYGVAADLLRQAQQETEERYLSDETGE